MSDHNSGPRALADPVVDITDMYVFPAPERPGTLVLVMDVFPSAGTKALFSDVVDYRFRVRPVALAPAGNATPFIVSDQEYTFSCRFSAPADQKGDAPITQDGTCTASTGHTVAFRLNDEKGGLGSGLRAFAGRRLDPFFFDGVRAVQSLAARKLLFVAPGDSRQYRQNCLSIVIEVDVATIFGAYSASLFAVVGETATPGPIFARLERFGHPLTKSIVLGAKTFDTVNRDLDIRDLYNQEDAFKLGPAYLAAYHARMNANLAFWDSLDQKIDWPPDDKGNHPLTELLLADYMVVDMSKPYVEVSYFEIERAWIRGISHQTCGGRTPNDDVADTILTMLVTGGNGPAVNDGVDQQSVKASRTFPYLAPPDPNPPGAIELKL